MTVRWSYGKVAWVDPRTHWSYGEVYTRLALGMAATDRTYSMLVENRSFTVPYILRDYFTLEPILAVIKYGGGSQWGYKVVWGQQLPAAYSTNPDRTFMVVVESRSFTVPYTLRDYFAPEPILAIIEYGGDSQWGYKITWGQQMPAVHLTNPDRTFIVR